MGYDTMTFGPTPAVCYGGPSDRVWLFVHGQGGGKEEAAAFAAVAVPRGWQVVGIDLPAHGGRRDGARLLPWVAVPELRAVSAALHARWRTVRLRANSIGACLSMLALGDAAIEKALFVSPVVDMAALIGRMMQWAGVTEAELAARGEIPTDFGETLSWDYLRWVRAHPPVWTTPTEILYAGRDHLVPRTDLDAFCAAGDRGLTVYPDGEHWFHTPEQLRVLRDWEGARL